MSPLSRIVSQLPVFMMCREVGKYVQSLEDPTEGYKSEMGLNPYYYQTETGLVIEERNNVPAALHTPYGMLWLSFQASNNKPWRRVVDLKEGPLKLEMIQRMYIHRNVHFIGPFWRVVEWDGNPLPPLVYRKRHDYFSSQEVMDVWHRIISSESKKK